LAAVKGWQVLMLHIQEKLVAAQLLDTGKILHMIG
jgi:hypothetical protein